MGLLSRIRNRIAYNRLPWWQLYAVQITPEGFSLSEIRPNAFPTVTSGHWSQVSSVAFLDGGLSSDEFFVYLADQPNAIRVPVEACGGTAFWDELRTRGLFPQEVSGLAVRSTERGAVYKWPPSTPA